MKKVIIAALAFAPVVAFAQTLRGLDTLLRSIGDLVEAALPILVGVALLAFIWGLVKFIFTSDDDGKKAGKDLMIWGLIALFVIVSVWGIVRFFGDALGIAPDKSVVPPTVQGLGN